MSTIKQGTQFQSWTIGKKIGSGACSQVYCVTSNTDQQKKEYAMKVSSIPEIPRSKKTGKRQKTDSERAADALYAEHLLYQGFISGHPGIPVLPPNAYGESQGYRFLVIELLGRTLEDVHRENPTIPVDTAARLGNELLDILQHLHSKKIIFVDVKPENFMIRKDTEDKVYCVDFGIAERYILATGKHKDMKTSSICGTPTFLSLNTHQGTTPSRRDDIEALLYVLIYLMKGSLPWQNATSDQEGARIKKETSISEICKGLPNPWTTLLEKVRSYGFDTEPEYDILKQLFLKAANGNIENGLYQWKMPLQVNKLKAGKNSNKIVKNEKPKETQQSIPSSTKQEKVQKTSKQNSISNTKEKNTKSIQGATNSNPKITKKTSYKKENRTTDLNSPRKPRKAAIAARAALIATLNPLSSSKSSKQTH